MAKLGAGERRQRVLFQQRPPGDDGMGGTVPGGEFATAFEVWAKYLPLRGSESVMQSRLSGQAPYVITVRRSSETLRVNTAWRIVDKADPSRVFAITAPPSDPDGSRMFLEFLCVLGQPS